MLGRVRKTLLSQLDILQPAAVEQLRQACSEFEALLKGNASSEEIRKGMKPFEKAVAANLRPYPNASARENVDVILVALTVALAIRTFFLQPMAIPTGSMQPTLFGIRIENLKGNTAAEVPGFFQKIARKAIWGEGYIHVVAEEDGDFMGAEEPRNAYPLVQVQRFQVGSKIYKVWFPPEHLFARLGIARGQHFKKGEDILKLKVTSGDHLFVNRMTYNFRKPQRGEIVIFESTGIPDPRVTQNTHYIKRLVGLGGETVQIGNDRHVVIDGKRLNASTPHFENVYSFKGPPVEDHYSGHVNDFALKQVGRYSDLQRTLFPDGSEELKVRPRHYLVLGDNTMNSLDSRYWRDFPEEKVIGKHAFVFWPISSRFGWHVE